MTPARQLSRFCRITFASVALGAVALDPAGAAQGRGDVNSPIDLVMIQCLMPSKVRIGERFQLRDEVENAGESVAPETITIYFLSTDEVLDEKDIAIKGRRVPPLDPGQRQSQPVTMTIDAKVPAGAYFLIAAADARRQVEERHEGNNTKATAFTLLPRK